METKRQPVRGMRGSVTVAIAKEIAAAYGSGASHNDCDARFGIKQCVTRARLVLGVERIPVRPAHPKQPETRRLGLITSRDIGRHLERKISETEFVVRDEHGRHELWKRDPKGILFAHRQILSFVIVMGMTERRVPEDLRSLWPV